MQATAKELLRTGTHGIRSAALVREAFTYVELGRGKTGPEPGKASDRLMAWMVGQQVAQIKPVLDTLRRRGPVDTRTGGYAAVRTRANVALVIGEHTAFISRQVGKTGLTAARAASTRRRDLHRPGERSRRCAARRSHRTSAPLRGARGACIRAQRGRDPRGETVDPARRAARHLGQGSRGVHGEVRRRDLREGRKRL
jgi:hypothetical protein